MLTKRKKKSKQAKTSAQRYARRKEQSRLIVSRLTSAGQNIHQPHPPKDEARRAAAFNSFRAFCDSYFPLRFDLPWSPDHLQVLARIEEATLHGGRFALAMPRGGGKTSICEAACLWAVMTGRHRFVMLLAVSATRATELLNSIKTELLINDLLWEDWAEVCHPIRALEDRANRAKGQHIDGAKTYIGWRKSEIVLPVVAGSVASSCLLRVAGLTGGGIRGPKFTRPDGVTVRPSLALIDDPQDDESARSAKQCEDRLRLINGAVLGMAGPGKPFTAVCPCTVIQRGDLSDSLLDRAKSPLWTGQRYQLLPRFPDRMDLWDEYNVRRSDEFRNGGDGKLATAWYGQQKEIMDRGGVASWPERFKPDELGAVQHAMNLLYADKWAFHAEYQNAPLEEKLGDGQLDADTVGNRVSGLARGVLPLGCSHVTAFIDVQQRVLFWLIAAWSEDFSGSIIDYGAWPDQGRRYFTAADVQRTIARVIPGAGLEGQIHAALTRCADALLGRSFARQDGAAFRISRLLIDAGFQGDTVKSWARTTHHAALVMPSHGHGIGAAGKPWSEYDRSRCEKLGLHWLIPKLAPGKKSLRHVTIDTNFWKSFVAARLSQAVGDKGALTIWGDPGQDHKMLADHLTAEYWIATEGRGRKVHEWRLRPGQTENHWFDCLTGAAVAASMQGVAILGAEPPRERRRVSYAELQRQAKGRRA